MKSGFCAGQAIRHVQSSPGVPVLAKVESCWLGAVSGNSWSRWVFNREAENSCFREAETLVRNYHPVQAVETVSLDSEGVERGGEQRKLPAPSRGSKQGFAPFRSHHPPLSAPSSPQLCSQIEESLLWQRGHKECQSLFPGPMLADDLSASAPERLTGPRGLGPVSILQGRPSGAPGGEGVERKAGGAGSPPDRSCQQESFPFLR